MRNYEKLVAGDAVVFARDLHAVLERKPSPIWRTRRPRRSAQALQAALTRALKNPEALAALAKLLGEQGVAIRRKPQP